MRGRPLDQPFGERAEPARRVVPHHEHVIPGRVEVELRYVGARIQLAYLGMDDVVERANERASRGVPGEQPRVVLGEQRHGLPAEPPHQVLRWCIERP